MKKAVVLEVIMVILLIPVGIVYAVIHPINTAQAISSIVNFKDNR